MLTKQLSPKVASIIAASVLLALGAIWWGPSLYRKWTDKPPTKEEAYSTVWSYLRKRTGEKNFELNLSSVTNELTGAAEETSEPPRKRRKQASQTIYAQYFKQKQDEAGTYKQVYKLIGQELKVAEALLASSEPSQKEMGLALMSDTIRHAHDPAVDPWLGARICEAYLWPNLEVAESLGRQQVSAERLLSTCENAFREAGETNNVVHNYKLLIAKAKGTQVDISRFRLARVLEEQGEYAEALSYLKQITATNKNGLPQRIASLEQKLKSTGR